MSRTPKQAGPRSTGGRTRGRASQQIRAGRFKATCLALMDRVRERREEYVITKRGTPVARLVPVGPGEVARTAFGWMKGSVTECGDVIGPSGIEWDALQGADGSEGPGR